MTLNMFSYFHMFWKPKCQNLEVFCLWKLQTKILAGSVKKSSDSSHLHQQSETITAKGPATANFINRWHRKPRTRWRTGKRAQKRNVAKTSSRHCRMSQWHITAWINWSIDGYWWRKLRLDTQALLARVPSRAGKWWEKRARSSFLRPFLIRSLGQAKVLLLEQSVEILQDMC